MRILNSDEINEVHGGFADGIAEKMVFFGKLTVGSYLAGKIAGAALDSKKINPNNPNPAQVVIQHMALTVLMTSWFCTATLIGSLAVGAIICYASTVWDELLRLDRIRI